MDDREHAIRHNERGLVLDLLRREVRAYFHETGEVGEDTAEDVILRITQAVRHQLPGHAPGAA